MTAIKPFADQGNFITMHRVLFDEVMPRVSGTAWKVLSFIVRKTLGWQKERDKISYSQIQQGTGIASRSAVSSALHELQGLVPVKRGRKVVSWKPSRDLPKLIVAFPGLRLPDGRIEPTSYELNTEVEIKPSMKNRLGGKAQSEKRTDNKQISISNSERSNLTTEGISKSEVRSYGEPSESGVERRDE